MIGLNQLSPLSFPFNVTLREDDVAETSEHFSVILTAGENSRTHVSFTNQESTVEIIDDDGRCKQWKFS